MLFTLRELFLAGLRKFEYFEEIGWWGIYINLIFNWRFEKADCIISWILWIVSSPRAGEYLIHGESPGIF